MGNVTRGLISAAGALALTLGSMALGQAYVAYLGRTPFPPASAEVTPYLWLALALLGLTLALRALVRALRALRRRPARGPGAALLLLGTAALLLALPNIAYAALYVLGALIGD